MVDVERAQALARDHLAEALPRRWRHVCGVAARAGALPRLSPEDRALVVAAAWLHDIGYAPGLAETKFHQLDGARAARAAGFDDRVVNLVAHHSSAGTRANGREVGGALASEFPHDPSLPHDELAWCDQTTSPDGAVVDVHERLAEKRSRRGTGGAEGAGDPGVPDPTEEALVAAVRRVEARHGLDRARSFTAVVTTDGRRVLVPLPFDPDEAWGPRPAHHVHGTVAGMGVRAVVEPLGVGHGILLGPAWRRDCGIGPGDEVAVVLTPEGPQRDDLAPDIAAALDAEPAAAAMFDSLAQFYRRAYLRWIDGTKRRPDVRAARIAEMVELLKAGHKERPRG